MRCNARVVVRPQWHIACLHDTVEFQAALHTNYPEDTVSSRFPVKTAALKSIDTLETGTVWVLKDLPGDAFFTIGKIATDWDGDPQAYGDRHKHPGISPHDHLGNAGHAGNWWGVMTSNGKSSGQPLEQSGVGPAQPYEHYMISTTKLSDHRYTEKDVRHWTDATRIPFVALPNSRRSMVKIGLKTGCYCVMVNLQSMRFCYGVYADSKAARGRMGEISKRAVDLLGNQDGSILLVVFPTSGQGQGVIPDEATINTKAREELKQFSLRDRGDELVKALTGITNLSARLIQAGYVSNTRFTDIDADGEIEVIGSFGRSR